LGYSLKNLVNFFSYHLVTLVAVDDNSAPIVGNPEALSLLPWPKQQRILAESKERKKGRHDTQHNDTQHKGRTMLC
jgi:hypothetical protein